MIQINKQTLVIAIVGLGLILLVLVRFGLVKNGQLQVPEVPSLGGGTATEPAATPPAAESNGGTGTATTPPAAAAPKAPSAPTVKSGVAFVTPAMGDAWRTDLPHTILWDEAPGEAGSIYLVNADTGKLTGWVLPSSGAKQTSYSWNTRDVSEGIVGGTAVSVQPGRYYLTFSFDGKLADVKSGVFQIAAAGQAERVTRVVTLKNVSMNPAQLEVPRGVPVAFVNYDTVAHTLTAQGVFGPFTIAPGSSYTMTTLAIQPGTYNYYSNVWTYRAAGTLIVK